MQYEKEFLRNLYRNLLDMRLLEQKMVDTYAQGRVPGHIHSGVGQEASFVGVLANFKAGDYYKRTRRLTAVPYMMEYGNYDQKDLLKGGWLYAIIACVVSVGWIMTMYPVL